MSFRLNGNDLTHHNWRCSLFKLDGSFYACCFLFLGVWWWHYNAIYHHSSNAKDPRFRWQTRKSRQWNREMRLSQPKPCVCVCVCFGERKWYRISENSVWNFAIYERAFNVIFVTNNAFALVRRSIDAFALPLCSSFSFFIALFLIHLSHSRTFIASLQFFSSKRNVQLRL